MNTIFKSLAVAIAVSATSASATPIHANEAAAHLAERVLEHMTISYMCREDIGVSHYQFARANAVDTAVIAGMDRDDATIMIDKIDQDLRGRPDFVAPLGDAALCWELLNEAIYQLQVATARMNADD